MDPKQQLARALACHGCGIKRTVVQFAEIRRYGGTFVRAQLCGACLIDALKLLLSPNLERKATRAAKKGERREAR